MRWKCHFATHVGLVRETNQDTVLVDKERGLFIVADGMGGHQGGEVASRMAADSVLEQLKNNSNEKSSATTQLKMSYESANQSVHQAGEQDIQLRGMGTTLCVLWLKNDGTAYIGNVGDSRVYMSKGDKMWLLTEDHTFANSQLKASLMATDKLPTSFVNEHVLIKSVGFFSEVKPDVFERSVESGETYLLCSDGLSGLVSNYEIQEIISAHSVKEIPEQCVKKALDAGGIDNISVIAIEVQ